MDTEQMAILEDAIGKEYLCAGSWQERYRRATEKYETQRILRSLSQQKRQTPRVDQPLRMPTSSAAARLWLGNIATEDELLRRQRCSAPSLDACESTQLRAQRFWQHTALQRLDEHGRQSRWDARRETTSVHASHAAKVRSTRTLSVGGCSQCARSGHTLACGRRVVMLVAVLA
jgi:hypothetical protein